jgi:hypothetical protein
MTVILFCKIPSVLQEVGNVKALNAIKIGFRLIAVTQESFPLKILILPDGNETFRSRDLLSAETVEILKSGRSFDRLFRFPGYSFFLLFG